MDWPKPSQISWLMPLAPREDPDLLSTTLDCLRHQTLQAHELVIAADGPLPEQLMAVVESCNLPWQLHRQSQNQGIGATLAVTAPKCEGDFILRIDSDDLYAKEHTASVASALKAKDNLGVVGCQLLEVDTDQGCRYSARRTPTQTSEALRWLSWRNPINHQTVALRRQALVDAGGYRHCPGFEDWDLWLRIAAAGYDLCSLPSCTVAARVNRQHRARRRGWKYILNEYQFYYRQICEERLPTRLAIAGCMSRVPWRLAPSPMLRWWMHSRLRGSPTLDTAWITELLGKTSG
jgi:glycosyltransferase involved in cell wall biosynthesis